MRRLAVGNSMPCVIDIYDCAADPYFHLTTLKGHTSAVLHLDWDESGTAPRPSFLAARPRLPKP